MLIASVDKGKNNDNADFLDTLFDYAQTGNDETYYKNRFHILRNKGKITNFQISCPEKIVKYFSAFMGENYAIRKTYSCSTCNNPSFEHKACSFELTGSIYLETKNYFYDILKKISKQFLCGKCATILNTSLTIEDYLVVHLENLNLKILITELKNQIFIDNQVFDISGVIGFDIDSRGFKESNSYYKTVCNSWYFQNFCDGQIHKITQKSPFKIVNVSLIIYIPRENSAFDELSNSHSKDNIADLYEGEKSESTCNKVEDDWLKSRAKNLNLELEQRQL